MAVVAVLGAGVVLFPSIAGWLSQVQQAAEIGAIDGEIEDLGPDAVQQALAGARAYNAALVGGAAELPANERLPQAVAPDQEGDYAALLDVDSSGLMARVKVPSIAVDLPVYHGTSEAVLEEGVGHLEGTALPVGGAGTHAVLTGHRGLATSELFTNLDRVQVGETFTVEVFGEVLTYRVTDTRVVEPEDTETLLPVLGEDLVTLVTCTPLGVNSHRILVTGERILPTPAADVEAAGRPSELPGFPWWAVILGAVLLLGTVYVWWSGRPVLAAGARKRRRRDAEHRLEHAREERMNPRTRRAEPRPGTAPAERRPPRGARHARLARSASLWQTS
ncbi:class C sortase [Arenivirga flava]|uniref:class C sortase n=1 Tax=Arenivirga flava TaxID=1930060 RepID=UPI0024E07C54|nr:class C sortase [Arenivirga flava]